MRLTCAQDGDEESKKSTHSVRDSQVLKTDDSHAHRMVISSGRYPCSKRWRASPSAISASKRFSLHIPSSPSQMIAQTQHGGEEAHVGHETCSCCGPAAPGSHGPASARDSRTPRSPCGNAQRGGPGTGDTGCATPCDSTPEVKQRQEGGKQRNRQNLEMSGCILNCTRRTVICTRLRSNLSNRETFISCLRKYSWQVPDGL